MKNGKNYEEYINKVVNKVKAWKTVCDCFPFRSQEMPVDVQQYFETLEAVVDAAYPDCDLYDIEVFDMKPEEETCKNLIHIMKWYEKQGERQWCNESAFKCRMFDKSVAKDIGRLLKHTFGVKEGDM